MVASRKKKAPSRCSLPPTVLEQVLDGIRNGRTIGAICSDDGMPPQNAILRTLSVSPEIAAKIIDARRIGVWAQLDGLIDKLEEAETKDLPRIKELANHIRWLASKLAADTFAGTTTNTKEVMEVRWLETSIEAEKED